MKANESWKRRWNRPRIVVQREDMVVLDSLDVKQKEARRSKMMIFKTRILKLNPFKKRTWFLLSKRNMG